MRPVNGTTHDTHPVAATPAGFLAALESLLSRLSEMGPDGARPFSVAVRCGGLTLFADPAPGEAGAALILPAYERCVLAACTTLPQPRKVLARVAGKRHNSRFNAAIRELLARDLVAEDYRGVRLATV